MPRFSSSWFTAVFCLAYVAMFAVEWPLLHYYPLTGQWSLTPLGEENGPVMQWYGMMAGAGLAGLLAGLVLGDRHMPHGLARWLFVVPLAAMALCLYFLRGFFIL